MAILVAKLGWRLPCQKILRFGRIPNTWRTYTASADATVDVKSESESGTEPPVTPHKHRRGRNVAWTPDEISLVHKLADDGLSILAIAARLSDRSYYAVTRLLHLRQSGAPVGQGRQHQSWSSQEIEEILSLSESGASFSEIAKKFPQRTEGAIKARLRAMKLNALLFGTHGSSRQAKPRKHHRQRIWTADEIARLHCLAKEKLSMAQVAEKLNRSEVAVERKWRRTCATGEAWPTANHWKPQDEAELVRMRTAGFSMDEIGKVLHRSASSCMNHWLLKRPRLADGTSVQSSDLGPHLSDPDFYHIVHMRRSGTSWQDVQQSRWPAFHHTQVRREFHRKCMGRLSEHKSRLLREKHAPPRKPSGLDWTLIRRMRDEGDSWATISCTFDPETPYLRLVSNGKECLDASENSSFGEAAVPEENAHASCRLS